MTQSEFIKNQTIMMNAAEMLNYVDVDGLLANIKIALEGIKIAEDQDKAKVAEEQLSMIKDVAMACRAVKAAHKAVTDKYMPKEPKTTIITEPQ